VGAKTRFQVLNKGKRYFIISALEGLGEISVGISNRRVQGAGKSSDGRGTASAKANAEKKLVVYEQPLTPRNGGGVSGQREWGPSRIWEGNQLSWGGDIIGVRVVEADLGQGRGGVLREDLLKPLGRERANGWGVTDE